MKRFKNQIERESRIYLIYGTTTRGNFVQLSQKVFTDIRKAKLECNKIITLSDVREAVVQEEKTFLQSGRWLLKHRTTVYCAHKPF